jgi:hypothetical protein
VLVALARLIRALHEASARLYGIANALWYWAPLRDPRDGAPALADADIPHRGVFADAYVMTGAASRGAGAVRRRHGAPLSRGFPRLGRAGPGVPRAMGGRRQGQAAARRGVAA